MQTTSIVWLHLPIISLLHIRVRQTSTHRILKHTYNKVDISFIYCSSEAEPSTVQSISTVFPQTWGHCNRAWRSPADTKQELDIGNKWISQVSICEFKSRQCWYGMDGQWSHWGENVEDWRAGGETCLQRGRDAPCLLLRQHAASLSCAWPSSQTPFKLYRRFTAEGFLRGARHSHTGSWKFLRLAWSLWISFFPAYQSPQPLVQ